MVGYVLSMQQAQIQHKPDRSQEAAAHPPTSGAMRTMSKNPQKKRKENERVGEDLQVRMSTLSQADSS